MKEKPHTTLLDRERHIADVTEHFSEIIDVMRDMTNYGTNLIVRCFATGNRKLEDAIILGVLVHQAVAMFDALEILISNAAVYPSQLQARALFEASLYLDWILKENTEEKARYYYVVNVRKERIWAQRTQLGSPENEAFEGVMGPPFDKVMSKTFKELEPEGKKNLSEIDRVLSQANFRSINEAIETYKKKRKLNYEPSWHAPLGIKSVRQLAVRLNRLHEYQLFYSLSSDVMHSSNYKSHIMFQDNMLHFQPVRSLDGISTVLNFSISTMLRIYKDVLRHYRFEELNALAKKI